MSEIERLCAKANTSTSIPDPKGVLPESIMWMPPGLIDCEPSVNGKAMRLKFTIGPQHAQRFNEQLQEMRSAAKANEGDEPYIDFNHDDQERAGEVTEFYWGGDDPKTGGIRARINWSEAGTKAVLGRNYRRFSPQWDFHPTTHEPLYITENLGGLVNRAAIRNIASVIAKNGGASTSTTKTQMTEQEFKKIVDDALKPIGDRLNTLEVRIPAPGTTATAKTAAEQTGDLAKQIGDAVAAGMKPLVDRFEKADQDTKKATAKAAVEVHIKRGAIGPQDTDTISFWENAHVANAKNAEAQMAKLTGSRSTRVTTPTTVQDGTQQQEGTADPIIAKAHDIVAKSGGRTTFVDALRAAATSAEGEETYREFRGTFTGKAEKN